MTNPAPTAREQFEIVRRGYEPQQVDRRVAGLSRDLEAARQRVTELERRVEQLHVENQQATEEGPTFSGLGARIQQILGLAEEESKELRAKALEETDKVRSVADEAVQKVRAEAERYAQERRSDADNEAARILEDARRQSDQLIDSTERDAKTRREEAEALFETNRAKAAQAAADFETTLATRRDQAERDYTEQLKANENQLQVVSHRSEQLRLEAEKLRADADRRSKRTMEEAQRQADEIVAEAKANAQRIHEESQRELSAATQRRDSINSQLTNVRQMLATLTGAALPDPLAGDEPAAPAKQADKQADKPADKGAAKAGDKPVQPAGPTGPGSNVKAEGEAKPAAAAGQAADKPAGQQPAPAQPKGPQQH